MEYNKIFGRLCISIKVRDGVERKQHLKLQVKYLKLSIKRISLMNISIFFLLNLLQEFKIFYIRDPLQVQYLPDMPRFSQ